MRGGTGKGRNFGTHRDGETLDGRVEKDEVVVEDGKVSGVLGNAPTKPAPQNPGRHDIFYVRQGAL